ncbi:Meckel syndrome type 1 protein [Asbolus verrucosus]|uniref:Meckel syndrome type 1 protein n=1 Tax=Asbolus verrucosus TaxID=1661398 RepID=A0A482W8W7_ASBVE|nr:Meckel syndrome type 1 protein [Asbolus verrucosus]
MSHVNESLLKYTAIYRCCDDITDLKIRIKLKEIENSNDDDSGGWEQKTFSWQQKAFSKSEREFYKDEKNCVTDLEKKYHLDVGKSAESDAKFDLYSYINDDDFTLKEEFDSVFRRKCEMEEESDEEYDFKKSIMAALRNPIGHNHEFDAMFVMADLGEYVDTTWIKDERILCTLKYDRKTKILSIHPDFTNFEPYLIKINGNKARNFKYLVENVSEPMPEDERFKETELIRKINNHKMALRRQFIDTNFVLPPKNQLQVSLFFEILWAKQFEYDTIYVQYFIDLPPDWSCVDSSKLQGITQTCHTKNEEGLAHFGHVFDVVLEYNIEELGKLGIPKCPYIYFEIISKDSWSRYRTEGLTYKNLPVAKPGNYRFELQCFRLIPDSISGQLRRFFIGDCSNYSDITWIGVPKDYDGPILNKYGTNTVGTGQIGVRINVLHQSQAFLDCYRENSDEGREIFEKLNSSSLVKSVEQVLQAFKRARKNMIAARKNL